MSLDIGYVPSVVKCLYAEEDSPFYYLDPFDESSQEDRKLENSSIYMTDTSYDKYDCTEIPVNQSDLSFDSSFHSPDSIDKSFLRKSSHDYEFDLTEQVVDFSAEKFCQFQKREISPGSPEHHNGHVSKRHLVSTFFEVHSPRGSLETDRPSKDTLHTCQQCGKSFKRSFNLKKHLETHSDSKSFNCEICKLQFQLKSELGHHMLVHSVEKLHMCHTCGKFFKTEMLLKRHLTVHGRKRSFCCEICKNRFRSEKQLEEHVANHSEVKQHLIQPRQRDRSLEKSLHCGEERRKENGTPEFLDLTHFSQNLSGNDARTDVTTLDHYGIFPQVQTLNNPKLDGSVTFGAESPIHVVSASSTSDMVPTSDTHTIASDLCETWSVNENGYTFISSPLYWETLNRITDNPSVMHSNHFLTSL